MPNYQNEPIDALRQLTVFLLAPAPPADGSGVGGQAGLVTVKISKAGADFAAYAGSIDETGGGVAGSYTVQFAVADWDTSGPLAIQITGPNTALYEDSFRIEPNAEDVLWYGKATAGAAGTVTLDATAVATSSYYAGDGHGCIALIPAGTGKGQARFAIAYTNTRILSIVPNWNTIPDATSEIRLVPHGGRLSLDERTAIQAPLATAAALAAVAADVTAILDDAGRIVGLLQGNSMIDSIVWVGSTGCMTSARQRDFADAAALAAAFAGHPSAPAGGNDGEIRRWTLTAVSIGGGQFSSLKKSLSYEA